MAGKQVGNGAVSLVRSFQTPADMQNYSLDNNANALSHMAVEWTLNYTGHEWKVITGVITGVRWEFHLGKVVG